MNSPGWHRLFAKQLAAATSVAGTLDVPALAGLVGATYGEADRERRRTERAMDLMADEIERANAALERVVQDLRVQNLRFETAIENMSLGIAMYDADEILVVCNGRLNEVLSVPPGTIRAGMSFREVVAACMECGHFEGRTLDDAYAERRAILFGGDAPSIEESRIQRKVHVTTQPMPNGGWLFLFEDMTLRREAEERVAHMAWHDALTGLANRLKFDESLQEALVRGGRGEPCAVLCIDLDRFKIVNDTLGHPVGDALLRAAATRLRAMVRETDVVARLGGDEFAIVQRASNQPYDAIALAQRIVEDMSTVFDVEGHHINIGASVGIALAPNDGLTSALLLKSADLALYRAKSDGRGAWRFFEPEMDLRMQARRALELDMRRALVRQEFEVFYQPLIDVESRGVLGFEALVRWRHPERGMVSPGEFIPLAEETGLIVPLGAWVMRRACEDAAPWPDGITVAVNVSSVQFRNPAIVDTVSEALALSGLPAERLEIEVTESIMLHDNVATLAILHRLRRLGVSISMDDFGTGYSSLSYLRSFPFDKIKIDQSFVQDLNKTKGSGEIISAIIGLGASLGMRTIAEGVETHEQLAKLRSGGCREAQGYLFGQPMPIAQALALIASGAPSGVQADAPLQLAQATR
ncbi:MAG: EAL domain-containing protein [Pseudomonadota bacterium]